MDILIVEPYDAGSHRAWMDGYRAHSTHTITVLSLPGQYWKWRMQGGAVTLARLYMERQLRPDLIVASDMLNLGVFLALTRRATAGIPTAIYFHENQLTYPMGPRQRKEQHLQLALINYSSAMAADAVFFNSQFHQDAFFEELPRLLKHYPDFTELESIGVLRERSAVLPLGLGLRRFDAYREGERRSEPPLIVWNHRWDYDKNPTAFLNAVCRLAHEGIDFRVALTGENLRQAPGEFEQARAILGERVIQYGYLDFDDYARLLWRADAQVSTAYHDFFGISTAEAIYCGCVPFLPRRLNYPDLLPAAYHTRYLYLEGEVYQALQHWLADPQPAPPELREYVAQYDWERLAPRYDRAFETLVAG